MEPDFLSYVSWANRRDCKENCSLRVIFQNNSTWNYYQRPKTWLWVIGSYYLHICILNISRKWRCWHSLWLTQAVSITSGCMFHEKAEGTKTPAWRKRQEAVHTKLESNNKKFCIFISRVKFSTVICCFYQQNRKINKHNPTHVSKILLQISKLLLQNHNHLYCSLTLDYKICRLFLAYCILIHFI